jgi:H+/Cl- antiporter ClcA
LDANPFPWHSPLACLAVVAGKLIAISVSVHGGLRGGFIFPLFFAGEATSTSTR